MSDIHNRDHGSRHFSAGADAIKLDQLAAPDDNTNLNTTTGAHGLCPKLPGDGAKMLNGLGQWSTVGGMADYAEIRHEETAGTGAGSFNAGDWRTHKLNVEKYDPNGFVTLLSNRFTLTRGTYILTGFGYGAGGTEHHRARIWSTTRGTLLLGLYARAERDHSAYASVDCGAVAVVTGLIEITTDTETFELQMRCVHNGNFGESTGWDTEVYAIVQIWRASVGSSSSSSSG